MPETPEQLYERAKDALRMPPVAIWDDVLPPLPKGIWHENLAAVRAALE
jgi:hypothetical protein